MEEGDFVWLGGQVEGGPEPQAEDRKGKRLEFFSVLFSLPELAHAENPPHDLDENLNYQSCARARDR
jgi:hypothetical protein